MKDQEEKVMKVETVSGAFIAALIGFLTGLLALFQQDADMTLSAISQRAWIVLGVGALISFLKDYQALTLRRMMSSRKPPERVDSSIWVGLFIAIAAALAVSGCAGTKAAYKAADGLEETAKVVASHYYAVVREANAMKREGTLTGERLARAQDMARKTRPVIIRLANAARIYQSVKSAENEQALEAALTEAAVAISDMIDIIEGRVDKRSELARPPAMAFQP